MTSPAHHLREFLAARFDAELPPGAVAAFSLRLGQVGLEFLCLLLLARLLNAEAFGIYAVAMTCTLVLGVPAAAGFDRLLVREVAANLANRQWGLLRGVLRRGTQLALASSTILVLGLVATAIWVVREPELTHALGFAGVLLPLVALSRLRQAAVQGLGRVATGLLPETIVQPVIMLLLVFTTFAAGGLPRTGAYAMALQAVAAGVATIFGIWLLRANLPGEAKTAMPEFETRRWLSGAAPFTLLLAMNVLLTNADTLLLGWLQGSAPAGQYRVAAQMAMLVSFPATAINLAMAPLMARLHAEGMHLQLWQRTVSASRMAMLLALPTMAILIVAGKPLLGIFGAEFVEARVSLALLAVGNAVLAAAGTMGYLLIMTRHEKLTASLFAAAAVLGVGANVLLIPRFGMEGAAMATCTGAVGLGWALIHFARRHFAHPAAGVDSGLARNGEIAGSKPGPIEQALRTESEAKQ